MLGGGDLPVGLLPRVAGGHEDDLVEVEPGLDLGRGHQVTVVDGVEGAAHHADAGRGSRRGPSAAGSGVLASAAEATSERPACSQSRISQHGAADDQWLMR